ncbi:hypothetical protein WICMUC_001563 [Wickerhamomyces mucosus]|uniref:SET domain-containing protein n=1 Tax=Wickerhamomyces mucosus TaxID=1378264 RepID=A0A9P8PVG1_9ASCO|nr:hypothetical protein WICMUC_001563 [Wickerhamomyces mucosus]
MASQEVSDDQNVINRSTALLEDASTLLMFHNAAVTTIKSLSPQSKPPEVEVSNIGVNKDQEYSNSKSESLPFEFDSNNSQPEPGQPTLRKISSSSSTSSIKSSSSSSLPLTTQMKLPNISSPGPAIAALSDDNSEKDKTQKAIVAAAALAAAAGIPLPLINRDKEHYLEETPTELLESSVKIGQNDAQEVKDTVMHEILIDGKNKGQENENGIDAHQTGNLKNNIKVDEDTDINMTDASNDDDHQKSDSTSSVKFKESSKDKDDDRINPKSTAHKYGAETRDEKVLTGEGKPLPSQPLTNIKKNRKKKEQLGFESDISNNTKTKKESNVYAVDPDSGIISCICEIDEDDGYTIQCDKCFRWQHIFCMGIESIDDAPDDYQCNVCQPRKLDFQKARTHQVQRINTIKRRKERRSRYPVDQDDTNSTPSNRVKSDDVNDVNDEDKSKEQSVPTKPRNKPLNPYGKNLEENDIRVVGAKDLYKTYFFPLKDYDYQDSDAFNYCSNFDNFPSDIRKLKDLELQLKYSSEITVKPYTEINSKKFNGISKLGLFTEVSIPQNELIVEYLGEVSLKNRYIQDSRNHYRIWGVEKPNALFVGDLQIIIDARFSGNLSRFIRRSCTPNCELIPVKVADQKIRFVIRSIKPIKHGSELTVGWNWDLNHPIRSIVEGNSFDATNDADKPTLVLSVESILTFVECACPSNNDCALSRVKKASAHIYRATRKGNNTSGLKILQHEVKHTPIQERLLLKEHSIIDEIQSIEQEGSNSFNLHNKNNEEDIEIHIKPFIYNYIKKKRKLLPTSNTSDDSISEYLPIPIDIITEHEKPAVNDGSVSFPNKPVKKLSFADYKRKKKPT